MLILASGSPRRRELLEQIGAAYEVKVGTYAEDVPKNDDPEKFVIRQAAGKAASIAEKYTGRWVLGADTVVVSDGKILGKPRSDEEAMSMLHRLSGKTHAVYTGIALQKDDGVWTHAEMTLVTFRDLTEDEIEAYVETGEPSDKAGAYGIQGRGAILVEKIEGDYANVVGLPLSALYVLAGIAGMSL